MYAFILIPGLLNIPKFYFLNLTATQNCTILLEKIWNEN